MAGPMAGDSLTRRIARIAAQRSWETIPADVREIAVQCVLDFFGVALRGSREPLVDILLRDGGKDLRLALPQAALVNGAASHALDFDDVHLDVGHPSVAILPALLALAESRNADGKSLVTAYVAGYEAACTVGAAMGREHYERGFHTTATIGIVGAAVACGRLLELTAQQMAVAIGIAATRAAGLKAMFGTMCKPFHAGHAARDGLVAARLAAAGLTAHPDILDGPIGFLAALGTGPREEPPALPEATTRFAIRSNLFKYHAACYLTHAAIDSAMRIRRDPRYREDAVEHVVITASRSIDTVCNIAAPRTGLETKFSIRHVVAMALSGRETADPDAYTDGQADEIARLPMRAGIKVLLEPELPVTVARVDVGLKSGEVLTASSDSGEPATDLAERRGKLISKFHALASPLLEPSRRERFIRAVLDCGHCRDIGEIIALAHS